MTKTMKDIVLDILHSKTKEHISFKVDNLLDALNFGFSYLDSVDHVVTYVITNSVNMKKIFAKIPDSVLRVDNESIGELWTAKLLVSDKLKDSQIVFSNNVFSAVIDVDLNPNQEFEDAYLPVSLRVMSENRGTYSPDFGDPRDPVPGL